VVPGSLEIEANLEAAGLLDVYRRAGFRIGEPSCSMCIGLGSDRAKPGETWLSSQNRNFPNRMGKGSFAWLASAPTVAASAFDLRIRDPRPALGAVDRERYARLTAKGGGLPPVVVSTEPEPQVGAVATAPRVVNGAGRETVRGRVQLFGDHVDTDAMIAAEFCHLSDSAELGERAFLHFRPEFRERAREGATIVVAGEGWGTGSSREQAVWALLGAGVHAVVAKSFAYIHKRNLVNEALPFLVLDDEEFHRAVREGDEVEIDPATGAVRLAGEVYCGVPPIDAMAEIISSGGLVKHVKSGLEAEV
jgi:aconitate hydratase/homoaconitate hydratase